MASADIPSHLRSQGSGNPGFLVVDTESVPDGELLAAVKYPQEGLSPEEAIDRAHKEQLEKTHNESDFIPVTFHVPVAICVARVARDYRLQAFTCLDSPQYRSKEITRKFWLGMAHYCSVETAGQDRAKLVTFNGRGFDMPLLELAAFRHGLQARDHYLSRDRYRGPLDLQEFFTNFGGCKMVGGLNLLAKMLGLPGKMETKGHQVYDLYREGKLQEINEYCLCDTLDTYFIFLRTRVLKGDITLEREAEIVADARKLLLAKRAEWPILAQYLERGKSPNMA